MKIDTALYNNKKRHQLEGYFIVRLESFCQKTKETHSAIQEIDPGRNQTKCFPGGKAQFWSTINFN